MKKNILAALVISCQMCLGFISDAKGQTDTTHLSTNKSDNDSLVHIAYRTVEKKDLTGAISVLNPPQYLDKDYGTYPLEGVDAFVGGNNLWNIGTPLVLIDGVPRSVNDITSSEIDQITFLKGANAAVLYGSRAANGVILITTKRGKAGIRKYNVRVNTGIDVPKSYPDYLGSAEYMTYYNQASRNDGLAPLYADSTIQHFASHSNKYRYPDVNYFTSDYLRKVYNTSSANADFTSGTERARFYALVGFENQNSLLNFGEGSKDQNTRLNLRANIDLKINDAISGYVNVSTVFSSNRYALGNYWQRADALQPQRFAPIIPVSMISGGSQNAKSLIANSGNLIDGNLLGGTQQFLTNPIADVYAAGYDIFTSRQLQYTGGIDVDLKNAIKGLSLHGQMSVDYSNTYDESINNTYAVYAPAWASTAIGDSITQLTMFNKDSKTGTQNLGNTWSNQLIDFNVHLDYANTFNKRHNVSAILLADGLRARQTGDFQYRTNANLGLQLSYNYDHKYYADFGGALVNSTKLPPGKRVAFSPTVNLGWLLSGENFLKDSRLVNTLKLSASAGIINTDLDINDYYLYNAVYAPNAYFSWSDGTYTNRATVETRGQNPNLTYAKRKEINLSIEGSLFQNKLDFLTSAFFIKKDGIPVQAGTLYPSYFTTGYPSTSFIPYTNFEANRYQGFDFQVNFHQKFGEVKFSLGLAGTYVKTMALIRDELYADTYRNRVGKSISGIFGLQSEGLFADQSDIDKHAQQKFGVVAPGSIKYKDQNGDGVVDQRDEVYLGQWTSPFTGGVNLTAQWKGFTLFALGTSSFGGTGMRNSSYYWVSGASKYSAVVRNSWTENTKNTATYPRLTTLSGSNDFQSSDFWTYSTNRFNIAKVQLTYDFSSKMFGNSFVKGLKVYVSGNDLLTISKNRAVMELNVGSAPQTRFYNLGIKGEF
ncbi:MAG TPA: SusC/RagA family TonB-linked outer membrane protein [Hanamia sp.]